MTNQWLHETNDLEDCPMPSDQELAEHTIELLLDNNGYWPEEYDPCPDWTEEDEQIFNSLPRL